MSHLSLQGLHKRPQCDDGLSHVTGIPHTLDRRRRILHGRLGRLLRRDAPNFGAAVSFYGGGITAGRMGLPPLLELASEVRVPWLGLFGDLDEGSPSPTSKHFARPRHGSRRPPRSSATPTPITASTATRDRASTTRCDAADAFERAVDFLTAQPRWHLIGCR